MAPTTRTRASTQPSKRAQMAARPGSMCGGKTMPVSTQMESTARPSRCASLHPPSPSPPSPALAFAFLTRPRPCLPHPSSPSPPFTCPRPRLPHPPSPLHARVQHCVAVLEGNRAKIVVTRDGGKTWNTTMVEEDIHAALLDVHMIDEKEGWAAGGCKRERGLEPCPFYTPATRS